MHMACNYIFKIFKRLIFHKNYLHNKNLTMKSNLLLTFLALFSLIRQLAWGQLHMQLPKDVLYNNDMITTSLNM